MRVTNFHVAMALCQKLQLATVIMQQESEALVLDSQDSLQIVPLRLRRGTVHVQAVENDCRLFVVHGEGGGCILETTGVAATAWIPLRGGIMVHSSGLSLAVHAKQALVTEPVAGFRAVAHGSSRWLALVGGCRAWGQLLAGTSSPAARLLPAMYAADRELRRKIVMLARCAAAGELEMGLHAFASQVAALQTPLCAAIARSPGRTFATKLQVFLRLQRVRIFMAAYCERELDNEALARIANYSPCHFLRTFKAVFQETPHAYLVSRRLQRAERLLRAGDLAVTEVAFASGFENRSAFSRSYRQHFGMTASEAKRLSPRVELLSAME